MDVKKHSAAALARVLKVLVTIAFVCNLLLLPCVPLLTLIGRSPEPAYAWDLLVELGGAVITAPFWGFLGIWRQGDEVIVLTFFLAFCGICTAVILWQARRVLGTVIGGNTFIPENAQNMRRAAVCCFLISAAALTRVLWGFFYYSSPAPLFTYNALFVPIFLMGGLLCMVMSALFRQAAELKEENDLTI